MSEKDYVLGTHDEELVRLGLQHRVWRPVVLDCWQKAGITAGKRVLDLGCGEGKLVQALLADRQVEEIVGMDVSWRALEIASSRLKLERLAPMQREMGWSTSAVTGAFSLALAVSGLAAYPVSVPQRRLIQPAEVAAAVSWLCLPEAQSITGQALPIAGGEVM